jgi:undecaprenyl-diphosphatase
VLPRVFGWDIHQNDTFFLTFLVATHFATAIVLFFMFWSDWKRIIGGLLRSIRVRAVAPEDVDAKLAWLLVVGTIPTGILGLALEHKLRTLFASASLAAAFLIVNGVMLLACERLRSRRPDPHDWEGDGDERIATRSYRQGFFVGISQCLAQIPGLSRSGATMGGGLLVGLSNEDAARFSFLLATPIIGAAALLKLPELAGHQGDGVRGPALVGALCAAGGTFLAVKFLMRFFRSGRLTPFGIYCIVVGGALTIAFAAGA